jgi:hypothetical protein
MVTTYRPVPGWLRKRRSKNRPRIIPDCYQPLALEGTDRWIAFGTGEVVDRPTMDLDQWVEDNWEATPHDKD